MERVDKEVIKPLEHGMCPQQQSHEADDAQWQLNSRDIHCDSSALQNSREPPLTCGTQGCNKNWRPLVLRDWRPTRLSPRCSRIPDLQGI
ncbi:hypothetical protein BT69DRAFT_1277590 [Atractiella rhizophila]|nr:hypothetical protein BT69DRAFT_1277590 [Atractiella rhizophila]